MRDNCWQTKNFEEYKFSDDDNDDDENGKFDIHTRLWWTTPPTFFVNLFMPTMQHMRIDAVTDL